MRAWARLDGDGTVAWWTRDGVPVGKDDVWTNEETISRFTPTRPPDPYYQSLYEEGIAKRSRTQGAEFSRQEQELRRDT